MPTIFESSVRMLWPFSGNSIFRHTGSGYLDGSETFFRVENIYTSTAAINPKQVDQLAS
jgi:hypothetical protein